MVKQPLADTESAGALILGFSAFRTVTNKYLLFKLLRVWYFVIPPWTETIPNGKKNTKKSTPIIIKLWLYFCQLEAEKKILKAARENRGNTNWNNSRIRDRKSQKKMTVYSQSETEELSTPDSVSRKYIKARGWMRALVLQAWGPEFKTLAPTWKDWHCCASCNLSTEGWRQGAENTLASQPAWIVRF